MTLKDAKEKVMVALDEVESSDLLQNIEDYENKLPDIFDSVQRELAMFCKPIEKWAGMTIVDGFAEVPADCYEFKRLYLNNKMISFEEIDRKIYAEDGIYRCFYYAYPSVIDENTEDDYEFEIDLDAQEAMIYGVCAGLCINDDPEAYDVYLEKYNTCVVNIENRKNTQAKVKIIGGVSL